MARRLAILAAVLAALAAAPAAAATRSCRAAELEAFGSVPDLFTAGLPDSLSGVLMAWHEACGTSEVLVRTTILAAIWDDAFDESFYDDYIIDDLATYGPRLRRGRDPGSDNPRERYDAFTMVLADQLLPHTGHGSLEAFFCLFYSGRVSEAWTLLQGEELAGTRLARLRARELAYLESQRTRVTVAAAVGTWHPDGELSFVGSRPLAGLHVGVRGPRWLGRLVLESRLGRSDRPYTVYSEDALPRSSDRFSAVLVAFELGRTWRVGERHGIDAFGGVGADLVKPFKDEDLTLGTVNASLGLGYRRFLGADSTWMVGLDGRREWLAVRNSGGTPMGGSAWSVRLVLGVALDEGRGARQRALQP